MKRVNPLYVGGYWHNVDQLRAMYKEERPELVNEVVKFLADEKCVLDVGAGSGMIIGRVKQMLPQLKCSVCDYEELALKWLRDMGLFEEVFYCDVSKGIPKEDASFDAVVATEVLEHLDSPVDAVKEMVRVARHKVVVSVPYLDNLLNPEHCWIFDFESIFKMLADFGKVFLTAVHSNKFIVGCVVLRK